MRSEKPAYEIHTGRVELHSSRADAHNLMLKGASFKDSSDAWVLQTREAFDIEPQKGLTRQDRLLSRHEARLKARSFGLNDQSHVSLVPQAPKYAHRWHEGPDVTDWSSAEVTSLPAS